MTYKISRLFSHEPNELLARPRVSYKISEYVFDYIRENILIPNKLLKDDKIDYSFTLSFVVFDSELHKFFYETPFNTEENKFRPDTKPKIINGVKEVSIRVVSKKISAIILPSDYADIVYDMFGSFLVASFSKKVTKEKLDELKKGLNYTYINSIPFPAPFEEQKYNADSSSYHKSVDFKAITEEIIIKDVYKKHFGF
ncbi:MULTISPECIES: hypothetical protein [unclassified Lysinibacillus]|uniref:hypothetical protein n=1 Tax=unclassified Lysinibacillus TaxID=2636778 RepID=UPI003824D084